MARWLLIKLPSIVGFGITYCAFFSFFFLLFSKNSILSNRKKYFLLGLAAYMFVWRAFFATVSSRYSLFFVLPGVLLFIFLVCQFKSYHRFFLYLFFGYLVYLFVWTIVKVNHNHDVVREEAYYGIREFFQDKDVNKIRLVCDNEDFRRFAYYTGIQDCRFIEREASAPDGSRMALLPVRNYFDDVYVLLQDPVSTEVLSSEDIGVPPPSWKLEMEFPTNRKKKVLNRLYHFSTNPGWKEIKTPSAPIPSDLAANGDFESVEPGKQYNENVIFPSGWSPNGTDFLKVNPNLSVGLETENPISGKKSLKVKSNRLELLNNKHYQPGDYLFRFLLRGAIGSSILCRIYYYPKGKKGHVVNLEKYEIEKKDIFQCDFKINKEIFPEEECDFIVAFILSGSFLLDDLQLVSGDR